MPINMPQSFADVGNVCFDAISPSIITAAVNVEKNPMHPNTESIVDQCRSSMISFWLDHMKLEISVAYFLFNDSGKNEYFKI